MIELQDADYSNVAHCNALITLLDEYASSTEGGGIPLSSDVKSRLPKALSARPDYHGVLAFEGETPAGLINTFQAFSTFTCAPIMNVHDVAVALTHRRQGISRMMFDRVESIARELGCCKITLEALSNNEPANAAYRSLGFAPYQLDPAHGYAVFWEKTLKS